MKIAIVYTTKSGVTEQCAHILARELKNYEVSVLEMRGAEIAKGEFDLIIVGFPIRMGGAVKAARDYMKKNQELLLSSNAAYFICCGFIDCFEEYAKKAIPAVLLERAVDVECFGGLLDPSRVKGIDKMLIKMLRSEILGGGDNADQRDDMCLPTILDHNIVQLAEKIKEIK